MQTGQTIKNNLKLLKNNPKGRKSFILLGAVILIVLVSFFSSQILSLSSVSSSNTKDLYLYNQAELLGRSAIELAVLTIGAYDFSQGKCLNNIDIFGFIPLPNGIVYTN